MCAPLGNGCIVCRKYVDRSLERSLQGRKKQVKRIGELEIVYNVHKFLKTESEMSITISLSIQQVIEIIYRVVKHSGRIMLLCVRCTATY